MNSLIKEAEKNIVRICKDMSTYQSIVIALRNSASQLFEHNANTDYKDKFYKGIDLLLQAIYARQNELLGQCLIFSGIGGKDAEEFAFQKFKERFRDDDRMLIMDLLDENGTCPGGWSLQEEENFRNEAQELIRRHK